MNAQRALHADLDGGAEEAKPVQQPRDLVTGADAVETGRGTMCAAHDSRDESLAAAAHESPNDPRQCAHTAG